MGIPWMAQYDYVITGYSDFDIRVIPRLGYTTHLYVIIRITNASECISKSRLCRMARKSSSIDLIVDVILHYVLHVTTFILIGPVSQPTLFHIFRPLNSLTHTWDECKTIIDIAGSCTDERADEFLFRSEG
jgi:hypothetical protein